MMYKLTLRHTTSTEAIWLGLTHFLPENQFPAQSSSQLKQTQPAQGTHFNGFSLLA
jgi:hypothetical protein